MVKTSSTLNEVAKKLASVLLSSGAIDLPSTLQQHSHGIFLFTVLQTAASLILNNDSHMPYDARSILAVREKYGFTSVPMMSRRMILTT